MNNDELHNFSSDAEGADQAMARRWRLILGKEDAPPAEEAQASQGLQPAGEDTEEQGESPSEREEGLSEQDQAIDETLDALYGDEGGLSDASPDIARWLGDIQRYFPQPVA